MCYTWIQILGYGDGPEVGTSANALLWGQRRSPCPWRKPWRIHRTPQHSLTWCSLCENLSPYQVEQEVPQPPSGGRHQFLSRPARGQVLSKWKWNWKKKSGKSKKGSTDLPLTSALHVMIDRILPVVCLVNWSGVEDIFKECHVLF